LFPLACPPVTASQAVQILYTLLPSRTRLTPLFPASCPFRVPQFRSRPFPSTSLHARRQPREQVSGPTGQLCAQPRHALRSILHSYSCCDCCNSPLRDSDRAKTAQRKGYPDGVAAAVVAVAAYYFCPSRLASLIALSAETWVLASAPDVLHRWHRQAVASISACSASCHRCCASRSRSSTGRRVPLQVLAVRRRRPTCAPGCFAWYTQSTKVQQLRVPGSDRH
jgi:hypothetical protein